jgi:hypothetical protein
MVIDMGFNLLPIEQKEMQGGTSCPGRPWTKQRDCPARSAVQQRRLWSGPRKYAETHDGGKYQSRDIRYIHILRDSAFTLRGAQASPKEAFQLTKALTQDHRDLVILGTKLKHSVDHEAAAPIAPRQGEYFKDELLNGLARWPALFQALDTGANPIIKITIHAAQKKGALVTEGVIETGGAKPHRGPEITHRGSCIAALPEFGCRCRKHGIFIENTRSRHWLFLKFYDLYQIL